MKSRSYTLFTLFTKQHYEGIISNDGKIITAYREKSSDGRWEHNFDVTYTKFCSAMQAGALHLRGNARGRRSDSLPGTLYPTFDR